MDYVIYPQITQINAEDKNIKETLLFSHRVHRDHRDIIIPFVTNLDSQDHCFFSAHYTVPASLITSVFSVPSVAKNDS